MATYSSKETQVIISSVGAHGPKGDSGIELGPTPPEDPTVLWADTSDDIEMTLIPGPEGPVGPKGDKGDKGDPGGWVDAASFSGNLNTLLTPGLYWITATATPAPIDGTSWYGEVMRYSTGIVMQRVTGTGAGVGGVAYSRITGNGGSTWSGWYLEGAKAVTDHVAQTDPHTQYARKTATNAFTTGQFIGSSNGVYLFAHNTTGPVDARLWVHQVDGNGNLILVPSNDAGVAGTPRVQFDRDGGIRQNSIRDVVGTGFPEGVVTAPVGSRYRDTAATSGAIEWIKDSGTGTTGWKVAYGDTGWRALVTWDSAGTITSGNAMTDVFSAGVVPKAGQAGGFYIRRTAHDRVVFKFKAMTFETSSVYIANNTITNGFKMPANNASVALVMDGQNTFRTMSRPGYTYIAGLGSQSTSNYGSIAEFNTDDAWPSTLPGVAA